MDERERGMYAYRAALATAASSLEKARREALEVGLLDSERQAAMNHLITSLTQEERIWRDRLQTLAEAAEERPTEIDERI